MSSISKAQIAHVAHLARLELSEKELDQFSHQISDIIGYMDDMQKLDCSGVVKMVHPDPTINNTRADQVGVSLTTAQALASAPAQEEDKFAVPQILGE